jgi:hypothetical protein
MKISLKFQRKTTTLRIKRGCILDLKYQYEYCLHPLFMVLGDFYKDYLRNSDEVEICDQNKSCRISRWWLEVGSRKRASYSEILERCWRHTLQA